MPRLEDPKQYTAAVLEDVLREERLTPTARALLDEALSRFPDSAALWCLRGDVLQLADEDDGAAFEEAEAAYLKAAELEPRNPDPHEGLGRLYDAIFDEPERAAEAFRKAISLGAGASAHEGLAEVLAELDED
jgi:tetratricopeptide (TPR) repeat protein